MMVSTPEGTVRRAKHFASVISFFWCFYAAGVWYGARFAALEPAGLNQPAFLFGAVFTIWFVCFWGYIGFALLKARRQAEPMEDDHFLPTL